MPAVRMPLIQSAMALRTVSIQQSPSLAEVVDKGLEEIQEKNDVGQKLHKTPPFIDGWRFVPQCAPYDKGLLSTAEMERLRMYRRETPPAALLAEKTGQQRNQGDAHQSNAAASHELLHALRLGAG